jgi:predicted ArsR family transcriptional regulator
MMGRAAVHLKAAGAPLAGRPAVWAAIRELRTFTISDLAERADVSPATAKSYVYDLTAASYLVIEEEIPASGRHRRRFRYRLERDTGVEPPRVRRDGSEATGGRVQENLWRTARVLKEFTILELAASASTEECQISEGTAGNYVAYLHRAGYLLAAERRSCGRAVRYRFVQSRYTGPLPPVVQRIRQVWDANTGQVIWSSRPTDEDAVDE